MIWYDKIIKISLGPKKIFLFNTLTGAIDIFERTIIENIEKQNTNKLTIDPSLQEKLINRGYCFESLNDKVKKEKEVIQFLEKVDDYLRYNFVIIPTYQCNFSCRYCYEMGITYTSQKISLHDVDKIFHSIQTIQDLFHTTDVLFRSKITLMGGEPLLSSNKEIIQKILELSFSMQMDVVIITNGGTLVEFVPLFSQYKNGIEEIQITLDGLGQIHDKRRPFRDGNPSFEKIVEGIIESSKKDIKISIRVNLDAENIECIDNLASWLTAQKWFNNKKIKPYLFPMSDGGCLGNKYILDEPIILGKVLKKMKNNEAFRLFSLQFHGINAMNSALKSKYIPCIRYCEANKNQFVFDSFGNIYKCWFGIRSPQNFIVGKFIPKFFIDKDKVKSWKNRTVCNIKECVKCKYIFICGGGCSEKAWEEFRKINKPRCIDFEKILEQYVKYLWDNSLIS